MQINEVLYFETQTSLNQPLGQCERELLHGPSPKANNHLSVGAAVQAPVGYGISRGPVSDTARADAACPWFLYPYLAGKRKMRLARPGPADVTQAAAIWRLAGLRRRGRPASGKRQARPKPSAGRSRSVSGFDCFDWLCAPRLSGSFKDKATTSARCMFHGQLSTRSKESKSGR